MAAPCAVGIDFGTDNCVIAVCRRGGVDIIDNEVSNLSTPSIVAFGEKTRMIGESGQNEFARNPKNSVTAIKLLIGRKLCEGDTMMESDRVPYKIVEQKQDGTPAVQVMLGGNPEEFSTEAIMAMLLAKLKTTTENGAKQTVKDVVLSVPGYFTIHQRQAILDAAKVVGLNVVRLFNEHAAVALQYGITKQDLTEDPRPVMFVDFGHSALSVSVSSFVKGKLEVLATAFDTQFGGRVLDDILIKFFVDKFKEKTQIDLYTNPRALVKLAARCTKAKSVLSGNPKGCVNINIECLCQDRDLNATIQGEEFRELSEEFFKRIVPTLERCMADAMITKDGEPFPVTKESLHSIELIGKAAQCPFSATRWQIGLGGLDPPR